MVASLLVYKYYGYKFFGSVVYLGLGGGSAHWNLAFTPYLPAMVKFLPGGQVLGVIVVLCFLLAIFWWTPTGFLLGTRNLFAWSFDRLAPARVTDVSDRFHTPVVATVVVALVVELLNYLNIYQGLGAFLLNVVVIMGLAFIVVSVAAGSVPFRRAAMHEEAPGWARAKVAGVPVITLVALVSGLSWAFVIYAALHTGFGGHLGWSPMIKVFVAPLIAVVWYLGVSLYRRSQGISLTNTFREIPPE
jgi:amino acid transporter